MKWPRALVRLCLMLVLVGFSTGDAVAGDPSPRRPNIVLIVSDDHGLDALSAYGATAIRTPNLDGIARDGARFDLAFATVSSCSPSRSVILTGLQSHENGMYGLQHGPNHFAVFDDVRSLPQRLADLGYRTARIGKYHIAPQSVFAFQSNLSSTEENDPLARDPVRMADMSRQVIEGDGPFFLYFATGDPHRSPDNVAGQPNRFGNGVAGSGSGFGHAFSPDKVSVPNFMADTPDARAELAQYYQSVSRLDEGVGRLISILKKAGKYDNTVIVYLSDNGEAFPGAKTNLYDPGLHLPLLVRAPDMRKRGAARQAMVSWVDVTPTLLDYAGISVPPAAPGQGRSFRTIVDQGDQPGWDEVYASQTFHEIQMYYPMRSIRTRRYQFIWNIASPLQFPFALDLYTSLTWQGFLKTGAQRYGQRNVDAFLHRERFELYDLESDPGETRNLADDPAQAERVAEFKAKLRAFQQATHDRWIRKWDYE